MQDPLATLSAEDKAKVEEAKAIWESAWLETVQANTKASPTVIIAVLRHFKIIAPAPPPPTRWERLAEGMIDGLTSDLHLGIRWTPRLAAAIRAEYERGAKDMQRQVESALDRNFYQASAVMVRNLPLPTPTD